MRGVTRTLNVLTLAVLLAALATPHPAAQAPPGLVVGAGNFFSPIVANLERAVGFYRDGLGLEVTGSPSNAADNAPLRHMFGLPDAQLRWTVARPAGVRQGVEIVEISRAGGRPLNRRITDPGAMTLVLSTTSALPDVVARLQQHGGTPLSAKGRSNFAGAAVIVVRDPDDHFAELIAAGTAAPLAPRIRLTVQNLDKAMALYRDSLGLRVTAQPLTSDEWWTTALGLTRGAAQAGVLEVPGANLTIEFVQFANHGARPTARIQDPGSTRLQLQVRDLDAAVKAVVAAGGRVVSTGGRPVDLPGGRGTAIKAAIVQDPNDLFLVLIETAAR